MLDGEVSEGVDRLSAAILSPREVGGLCEGCRDLRPKVSAREGFILGQHRDGLARECEGGAVGPLRRRLYPSWGAVVRQGGRL